MISSQGARRRIIALVAVASAGLMVLSACSGGSNENGGDENGRATSEFIDFDYLDMSATVPADPERVVVIEGRGDLEFALLAGYDVVGTRNGNSPDGELPGGQFEGLLDPDTTLLSSAETTPSYEEIIALDPDLIVLRANAWREDFYGNERLSEIAPVLPVEVNRPMVREDTIAQLESLGRLDNAQQWIDDYDAAIAQARTRVADTMAGRQVAMLTTQVAAESRILVWTNTFGVQVAHDIGLEVMFRDDTDEEGFYEISTERLGDIADADVIFHQTTDASTIDAIPVWQSLPAVQRGDAHVFPWAYNNGLVITAAALAKSLADTLTEETQE